MIRRFLALARDNAGVAVIELALVAPILAAMIVGVADISIAYGKKLELEQAAQRAIEKVGQTTGEETPADTIKKEAVCQYNGTNASGVCLTTPITAANVTVTYSKKCNGTVTPYDQDCPPGQITVGYISTTVSEKYTPIFPIHFGTKSDGKYHLSGTAGVRVE